MAETVGRVHKLLSFLLQNTRGISVHPSEKFAIIQLLLFLRKIHVHTYLCDFFMGGYLSDIGARQLKLSMYLSLNTFFPRTSFHWRAYH